MAYGLENSMYLEKSPCLEGAPTPKGVLTYYLVKQVFIPVGCVPPASVTTTRCGYQGCTFQGVTSPGHVYQAYPCPPGPGTRHTHPHQTLPPQKGLRTRHTKEGTYLVPGIQSPPREWQTPVKILHSWNFIGVW